MSYYCIIIIRYYYSATLSRNNNKILLLHIDRERQRWSTAVCVHEYITYVITSNTYRPITQTSLNSEKKTCHRNARKNF